MGVHGLWDLLAPVGRRVSVETLAGKRLAIDASIWMVQFMKAMRDEKGEMVRNAHLLGFFRRICKLLFLRTKPVFVFDGGTPALKRRTVIARRRQRENAQAKVRKTAEKLFLNQMKAMRLSNLAENLKDKKRTGNSKGKEVMVEQYDPSEKNDAGLGVKNQEILDEMFAASIAAEECGGFGSTSSTPAAPCGNASAFTSTSAAAFALEDEDSDDEEMIMPVTDGNVDPAVLASLPPSMQLDLLVQMRERLMAENRQKYQKVKKAPQKFSELQIEAYLKTVAFRREIDEVQKAASGRGVGGVQTSRIASEANREFIFSSSFSGDKQALASRGVEKFSENQQLERREPLSNNVAVIAASGSNSNAEAGPAADEVETYVDERGRKRIHRSRAMGIRMTRDLQRNIDLMKESEHTLTTANNETSEQTEPDSVAGPSENFVCEGQFNGATEELSYDHNSPQKSLLVTDVNNDTLTENPIKISFSNEGKPTSVDEDDEFFSRLVSGSVYSVDTSASDIEWEDGTSVEQSCSLSDRNKMDTNSNHAEDANKSESDVEWEEVPNITDERLEGNRFLVDSHKDIAIGVERKEGNIKNFGELQQIMADGPKGVSKGSAEEEFALQEAIKRSLDDITGETVVSLNVEKSETGPSMLQLGSYSPQLVSKREVLNGTMLSQSFGGKNDHSSVLAVKDAYIPSTSDKHSESEVDDAGRTIIRTSVEDTYTPSTSDKHLESAADDTGRTVLSTSEGNQNMHFQKTKTSSESSEIGNLVNEESGIPVVTTIISTAEGNRNSLPVALADDIAHEEVTTGTSDRSTGHRGPAPGLHTSHADIQRNAAEENIGFDNVLERGPGVQITAPYGEDISDEILGASLEDELLMLGKEYKDLENEQKKLERNADSVNSEMFVECQELLQMFGLPYIIAPMEAEAQCAFLEFANLVDGVVTDDSDVFLFGAQSVFKNIFDDRKYVETYLLKDIDSELGLNTEKLIRMALLLGSDYTEGVSGIGIVNAIEVVNAFPEDDGLHEFREWVESPDPTLLGKVGLRSGLNVNNGSEGTSSADCNPLDENEDSEKRRRKQIFMNKHRNISKNWHLPASFPSDAVISAYKSPQVDKSAEPFGWGKPDIFSLRRLCFEKFAWGNQKADELLLPVLKEYNKHETQLRLEAFYSFNEKFANIRSKRIRQAVKGITGTRSLADTDDLQELPKQVKKRVENTGDRSNTKKKDGNGEKKSPSKRAKSKKRDVKMRENMRPITDAKETSADGAGHNRVKGSSSGKAVKRRKGMESSDSELDETSTDNLIGSGDVHEHVLQPDKAPLSHRVRRSKRTRKATSYVEEDNESDELTKSPTRSSPKCRSDEIEQPKSSDFQNVQKVDTTEASRHLEPTSEEGGLCEDYLFMGGGFCADEDNTKFAINEAGPIQSEGDSEYLQMGGGFCTDDAEDLDCSGGASNPNGSQGTLNSPSLTSTGNPSEQHKSIDVNPSTVMQTVEEHDIPAPVRAFSDIPLLKRKKRKT